MDFVVFGFGLGAILMLVGFALRDLGPWLFGSTRDEQALPEFEGAKTTIRKQTLSSTGNAISVGGAGIAAVTFSALLAKTDDDLGAIVVGMSLVLATVGVAAWTYDVLHRYRTAMEIIGAQEQAARERLAPRAKRRRPRPAAPEPQTEQPLLAATPPESAADANDQTPATVAEEEAPETAEETSAATDDHLPDWHEAEVEAPAKSTPDTDEAAEAKNDIGTPVPTGSAAEDRDRESQIAATPEPASPLAAPLRPSRQPAREQPIREPEQVDLPPLPVEADDTLIDEAVRFEPRQQAQRAVPSWLFEDLETDLTINNPAKQDDPLDQFQEARPVTRRSALERLLSEEPDDRDQPPGDDSPRLPRNQRTDRGKES